jgi:hypothetical protein
MKRILWKFSVASITFAIGIATMFAITGRSSQWSVFNRDFRSCQIKRVERDGHAVWTPCELSLNAQSREHEEGSGRGRLIPSTP